MGVDGSWRRPRQVTHVAEHPSLRHGVVLGDAATLIGCHVWKPTRVEPTRPPSDLERLVEHVSQRLHELSASRLSAVDADVRACLQELADVALRVEHCDPAPLVLPEPRAWGDVVAVLGGDLQRALAQCPDPDLEAQGGEAVRRLRHRLP
jgi:hypothetical protein